MRFPICMSSRTIRWFIRPALAILILTCAGCQGQKTLPVETDPPAAAPAPVVTATPAPSVTLALLGDVMLGRGVHPTPETFAVLTPYLSSADLALANLESPLTDSPVQTGSPYALCAPPGNVRYLVDAGFDLLAIANNHNLDCGPDGLGETKQTLTDAGLGFIGPDAEPVYRSVNGIPLAFLAFDAVSGFDLEKAVGQVKYARESGALVVVAMHWGLEYQSAPSTSQKEVAEALSEAGATLIWGHHPHVLQPAERLHTAMANTLVFYSLGNALFDQYGLETTRQSALVLVTLNASGVQEFHSIPFVIDTQESRLREAGQAEAQRIMGYFH